MKTFDPKPWVLPQPVLVIGTYDKDGTPNAMNAAWGGQWDAAQVFISMGIMPRRTTLRGTMSSRWPSRPPAPWPQPIM